MFKFFFNADGLLLWPLTSLWQEALHLSMTDHLPRPLVVEEEHQVELLVGILLPLLPQTEDFFGWDWNGHPVVQQTLLWHLWVDDLEQTNKQMSSHADPLWSQRVY